MQRVCFVLKVRADRLDEYKLRHTEVWPAMREALTATGWHDYSLFLRTDGLLVGYLLCDDFDGARDAMKCLEVNSQWQQEMAPFFEDSGQNPDDQMRPLEEVFHLD